MVIEYIKIIRVTFLQDLEEEVNKYIAEMMSLDNTPSQYVWKCCAVDITHTTYNDTIRYSATLKFNKQYKTLPDVYGSQNKIKCCLEEPI